jgi:hypothetical protein
MNAIAERWIGGCRRELLDRTLIWNLDHLQRILRQYESHHNPHWPHDMAQVPDAGVLTAAMRQDLPQRVRRADRRHRRPAATPPAQTAAAWRGLPAHRALTGPGWRRGGRERAGP